jgi:hypothetical protein
MLFGELFIRSEIELLSEKVTAWGYTNITWGRILASSVYKCLL